MKLWLNVREGAEYACVCRDTVYTACERREIRHARVGGRRAIRLKPEWIDAWLERHALDTQDRGTVGRTSSSGETSISPSGNSASSDPIGTAR
jgi:excisionase family DNA binding protein